MPSRELPPTVLDAVFAPLDDGGRARAVTRRLGRAIELGLLPQGAQLPSETELAAQLAVSTVTLREALATLRRDGLVETRRGRGGGTFVRAAAAPGPEALDARLRDMAVDDLRDIGDHCAAVRGAAARLAAERGAEPDLGRLHEQLARLKAADHPIAWRHAEGRFQVEIAATAHSTRLARAELALQAEVGDLLLLPDDDDGGRARVIRAYRRLIGAIERRDGSGARRMAERRVAETIARLAELHLRAVAP